MFFLRQLFCVREEIVMLRLCLLLLLSFSQAFGQTAEIEPYRIVIERSANENGELFLYGSQKLLLRADCREDKGAKKRIPHGVYPACSKTVMSSGRETAIFIPGVAGRNGIFVRQDGGQRSPNGSILVEKADFAELLGQLKKQDAMDIRVVVRTPELTDELRRMRKAQTRIRTALKDKRIDVQVADELLTVTANYIRLIEVGEIYGIVVTRRVRPPGAVGETVEDFLRDLAVKQGLKQVVQRLLLLVVAEKWAGPTAAVITGLLDSDPIGRDAAEILVDKNPEDAELAWAIRHTLTYDSNDTPEFELLSALLIRRLGYPVDEKLVRARTGWSGFPTP